MNKELDKKPLRDAKITSSKQGRQSSSLANENPDAGPRPEKRRRAVADTEDLVSKKLRTDSELPSGSQDESRQDLSDESLNPSQTNRYRSNVPHTLIRLMYQLDLSVYCSLKKFTSEHKYPLLSLAFEDSEIDKFQNIVLRYEGKSIHVQIEYVDKYYTNNDISYAGLFTKEKEKRSFFINNYFDGFVKYLISKSGCSLNNIQYLMIYTNSGFDLTEENKLKQGRSRNFYPFKFDTVNMEECEMMKDFFFTNDDVQERGFYQFSRDKTMREELLRRLEFSPAMQKAIKDRNPPEKFEEQIKRAFIDKLVFAVNQPSREELNSIVRREINTNNRVQHNYITLQQRILNHFEDPGKHKKLGNCVSKITYEFNLLILLLHDMFSHRNIYSINFEGKNQESNDITINYKDRITYLKARNADSHVGYSKLFPCREREEENKFSINKHFAIFVEELKNNLRYFLVYTNADLNLTEEKRFKKGKSRDFYPLKFESIDIKKKRYKVLRNCSCINENNLYKFAQDETTREKVSGLLKLPPFLQKEKKAGILFAENEEEIKENFLNRLIFAVKQPDKQELNTVIRNELDKSDVPYNHEELREIALRWLESHEFCHITKEIMEKLLKDVKNSRLSYQNVRNKEINKEINFAKSVVGRQGTPTFHKFLNFLIKGEGKKCLQVLKRKRIDLSNVSSILNKAGNNAVNAFRGLYDLWFDERGNESQYLITLEKEGISLASMSGILNGAGSNGVDAFEGLYDLWFDKEGNRTLYLITLEKEGINLASMSSILNGAGIKAPTAFKGLYDLLFDAKGNKTQCLITLEKESMNLASMSGILNGAGPNAVKAFVGLYDLWFDEEGNKTRYLKTLEKGGINLANMSSILNGAGIKAPTAFKELHNLWFDANGNKTQCLKTLETEGINLANMSSILSRAAANAAKAFKGLYDLWFDAEGNKTQYLKTLEKEGIGLASMSSILHGAAGNAVKAFKELYNTFFDERGNKKQHLKHFVDDEDEKKNFMLINLSSILNGAGANPRDAFEKLHSVCFNDEGKRTKFLDDFYNADFKSSHLSCMLCGAGVRASFVLKQLHSSFFDDEGRRTKLLNDFIKIGFTPSDLCNILSGAVGSLKKFHSFCFAEETKKYLNHFLNNKNGFMLNGLCSILHGARANVCSALKDFYTICFDEAGNKTQLLNDFREAGFTPNDLSHILSLSGNNAASVLKSFHKSCFNRKKLLNHFLAENKLFSPKDLSKMLHGVGVNICPTFEKLHDLCFDKAGNKSKYLNNLVINHQHDIFDVLYKKVRKVYPACL